MKLVRLTRHVDDPGSAGSLNDLSFLLIIFFIVIAGFNVSKGFLMNLPDTNTPRIVQKKDLLRCSLNSEGNILFENTVVTRDNLEEMIQQRLSTHPNMTFVLTIAPETPYQKVIDVIYTVRKLNVENFSFRMGES